jgi:FkbM family methyltransferase
MSLRRIAGRIVPKAVLDHWWVAAAKHFFPEPLLKTPAAGFSVSLDMLLLYLRHSRQHSGCIRYCQVGAFDGVMDDPLFPLIEKHGLIGVLLEPRRRIFERLKSNYSRFSGFTFVNAAIADTDGTRDLYAIKEGAEGPDWLHGISSFQKDVLMRHASTIPNLGSLVTTERVRTLTFATLFRECRIDHIDFLQIDTEGYDAEILKLFDFSRWKVPIVQFEHKHLSKEGFEGSLQLLIENGYKIAIGPEGDTLACSSSVFEA